MGRHYRLFRRPNWSWGGKPFNLEDYKYYIEGTDTTFSKYNDSDGLITLEPSDDAATINMGSNWRMPTAFDFLELFTAENIQKYILITDLGVEKQYLGLWYEKEKMIGWQMQDDPTSGGEGNMVVKGFKFISNGNELYFPCGGVAHDGIIETPLVGVAYWASNLYDVNQAHNIVMSYFGGYCEVPMVRQGGFGVRGVTNKQMK